MRSAVASPITTQTVTVASMSVQPVPRAWIKMNFKHDNTGMAIMGTSLVGDITTTYDKLVSVFGEPTFGMADSIDGKVSAEWVIIFDDGTVASIYDYKYHSSAECKEYDPECDCTTPPLHPYDWHIGGKDTKAVTLVKELI